MTQAIFPAALYPIQGDTIYNARTMTIPTKHPEISKRLKRAQGHLASILTMLEEERNCLEIAQQLHAVEKAICNAKKHLVHDHIDICLDQSVRKGVSSADDTIREFKEITKYL